MDRLVIPAVFDMHQHLRQGADAVYFLKWVDRVCDVALVMPNTVVGHGLEGPITTAERLNQYRTLLERAVPDRKAHLVWTLYLTEETTPEMIRAAAAAGATGYKIYPRGETTNSDQGIREAVLRDLRHPFWRAIEEIQNVGGVVNHHGEIPGADVYDAERKYCSVIDAVCREYPKLRQVVEHVTTADMVQNIREWREEDRPIAGTITAHHLCLTLNDVVGQTHNFCKPVAKGTKDRDALISAATGWSDGFFFGSDAAPHHRTKKVSNEFQPACAGCWTTPVMVQLVAQVFDKLNCLDRLPRFLRTNAKTFYNIQGEPSRTLTLERKPWWNTYRSGYVPFWFDKLLDWRVAELDEIPNFHTGPNRPTMEV